MASLDRTAYPRLAKRLSERELQPYTLTDEQEDFIRDNAKGSSGRLTLAAMLKTRQSLGYFPSLADIPKSICLHLAKQLNLPTTTPLLQGDQLRTSRSRYRLAIRPSSLEAVKTDKFGSGGLRRFLDSVDCGDPDVKMSCDGADRSSLFEHACDFGSLMRGQGWLTAELDATLSS